MRPSERMRSPISPRMLNSRSSTVRPSATRSAIDTARFKGRDKPRISRTMKISASPNASTLTMMAAQVESAVRSAMVLIASSSLVSYSVCTCCNATRTMLIRSCSAGSVCGPGSFSIASAISLIMRAVPSNAGEPVKRASAATLSRASLSVPTVASPGAASGPSEASKPSNKL